MNTDTKETEKNQQSYVQIVSSLLFVLSLSHTSFSCNFSSSLSRSTLRVPERRKRKETFVYFHLFSMYLSVFFFLFILVSSLFVQECVCLSVCVYSATLYKATLYEETSPSILNQTQKPNIYILYLHVSFFVCSTSLSPFFVLVYVTHLT